MQLESEGCLSVPRFYATVARPSSAALRGQDLDGEGAPLRARGCWPGRCSMRSIISTDGSSWIAFEAFSGI